MSLLKNVDGRVLDTKGKEEVLLQIGNLSRKPNSVIRSLDTSTLPEHIRQAIAPKKVHKSVPQETPQNGDRDYGELIIGGEPGIPYRFAHCCDPKPGDKVVGYVTKNALHIHRVTCSSVKRGSLDRLIPATWSNMPLQSTRLEVAINVKNKL